MSYPHPFLHPPDPSLWFPPTTLIVDDSYSNPKNPSRVDRLRGAFDRGTPKRDDLSTTDSTENLPPEELPHHLHLTLDDGRKVSWNSGTLKNRRLLSLFLISIENDFQMVYGP